MHLWMTKQILLLFAWIHLIDSGVLAWSNGVGATPAMGWNSWNYFRCNVNETMIRGVADAIVEAGLKDLGYQYVVIDDCWQERRGPDGVIMPFKSKFPSGMKALADYVHSKGLRFGLYSDAGNRTCEGYPGSWGHEDLDAKTYADWGVDFVKYDYCAMEKSKVSVEESYTKLRDALNKTGRPFYYSMCSWGHGSPWLWGNKVGHSWRVSADLYASWDAEQTKALYLPGFLQPVLTTVDAIKDLAQYAGPGGFNDPDMLVVGLDGMYPYGIVEQCPPHVKGCKPGQYVSREQWGRQGGLSFTEQRTHFALWCILTAPLILGNDPRNMSAATLSILKAEEFVAVNQDPLAKQGSVVWTRGPLQLWQKPLQDGSVALLLFNRGTKNADITVEWEKDMPELHKKWAKRVEMGEVPCEDKDKACVTWAQAGECEKNPGFMLGRCQRSCPEACPQLEWGKKAHSNALVRDLWWREDLGVFWDGFTAEKVEPHEGRLLKVTFMAAGAKPPKTTKSSEISKKAERPIALSQDQERMVTSDHMALLAAEMQVKDLESQLKDLQGELKVMQDVLAQNTKTKAERSQHKSDAVLQSHEDTVAAILQQDDAWENGGADGMWDDRVAQDPFTTSKKLRHSFQIQGDRSSDRVALTGGVVEPARPRGAVNTLLLMSNVMLIAVVAFFVLRMRRGSSGLLPGRSRYSTF